MKKYYKYLNKICSSLLGKNVIITGGTGGIAYYIVDYLLYLKANVYLACRNLDKGETRKKAFLAKYPDAFIEVIYLDVNKYETFNAFIESFKDTRIDYLINNAGIYHLKPKNNEYEMELHFSTNFFGPSLLTEMLLPLIKSSNGKIITMGSISYYFTKIDYSDIYSVNTKNRTKLYGRTKKLLMLENMYLKKNTDITINLIHPGITASTLFDTLHGGFSSVFGKIVVPLMHLIFFSPKKAALPAIYALEHDTKFGEWIGPRGLFHVYGKPKVNHLRKNMLNQIEIDKVNSIYEKLKSEVGGNL